MGEVKFGFTKTKTFEDDVLNSTIAISSADQFSRSILTEDIHKLKKFYFDNGFFDAQVDTVVGYSPDEKKVNVEFIISENKRFTVDSIFFKGLGSISPEAKKLLAKIELIKPKDFYNRKQIVNNTNEIISMLINNGYMYARLPEDSGTIVRRYDFSSKDVVTVTVKFYGTDSLFYFGKTKIQIADNKYGVSQEMLAKLIEYKEGEIYNNEKKLTSEKDMTNIPIIQSTRIIVDKINKDLHVDFIAMVTLNKRHEIIPSLGGVTLENSFYLSGSIEYQNRYFLGNGKSLSLELDAYYNSPSLNRFLLSAWITQPNLFNKKSSLRDMITIGFYNREDAENHYLGNITSVDVSFPKHSFFTSGIFSLTEELVRYIYEDTAKKPYTIFNTVVNMTLVRDKTDNPFSPAKGYYNSITVGSAGVLSRLIIDAFEPNWNYSQYIPVGLVNKFYMSLGSPNNVIATKLIYYENIEYGSGEKSVTVPSLYRYFSGGSNSLRGWKAKTNGILNNTYEGGNFLLESSIELRKKMFPEAKDFAKNISTAIFLDFGNVWEKSKDFRWDEIALSAGVGLRYDLAVGPVRLDIGYIIYDPSAPEDNRWYFDDFHFINHFAVHFAIGQAF